MALGLFCSGIFHLLVFQANCFPTKPSGSSAFPTASLEKYTHNEAYVTPTPFAGDSVDVHRSWKTSKSTSERGFVEDPHINLDDVVVSLGQEVSENVLAKRKRVDDFEKFSKSSRFSKDSTLGLDALFDTDIRHSTGIDLNSIPPGTPDDFWSEDAFVGAPSNAAPIVLSPKKGRGSEASSSEPRKLGTGSSTSNSRYFIQEEDPTDVISSNINIISSREVSKGDMRPNPGPKDFITGDDGDNATMKSGERPYMPNLQDNDHDRIIRQDTHQVPAEDVSLTEKLNSPQIHSFDVTRQRGNIEGASSSKSPSRNRLEAGYIFKKVGREHIVDSPVLPHITKWFDGLQKEMYRNNKKSDDIKRDIDCLVKRAQDDLTIGFLGSLYIFEYKKPQWTKISTLFQHGWEFMKSLLDQWKGINLEKVKKMKTNDIDSQKYWSDGSLNIVKILSMHHKQRIPKQVFLEIYVLWAKRLPESMQNHHIKSDYKTFFDQIGRVKDTKSLGSEFYRIACVNSPETEAYFKLIADCQKGSTVKAQFKKTNLETLSNESKVGLGLSSNINRLPSTSIDWDRLTLEGTKDCFPVNALEDLPPEPDSIILLPKMRKSTGDGHTALQKLGIRRSKNRNLIQNREPTSCITPTRDLILSPKSSIREVKRRKKSGLKDSKIGKSGSNAMLSENLKLFNSKFKSKKNEWMMHPEGQGTHWDTRGDFPPTEIADNLHKSPLNIVQTTDNIDLSSSRKFTSNIQPFYASGIFKGVGSFHLINSPILLDIDQWFDGLKKQMYHHNKGSLPGEINCLIKRAQDDLTIGFLGCLCVFEFKKPGWTDLSTLLENGWNFMKSLLGQWEGINLEDVKKMKDKGLLTGQKFWSDSPLSNVKYLLSIHFKQRIPQALFLEIHMLWTSKCSHSMANQQLKRQHQEFFTLLKGVDSKSVGEDFYKIVCINSPDFQAYLSRKLSDSTQIYTKQRNDFGDSLKKIGIDYAKLELKEDIDHYFEKLKNEMTDTLFEESDVEDCSDSMRFSSPLALGHLQTKKKASERLKKAIDSAKFKVTFAFLGSLIEIYNKTLQPKLIEEVLQSGWHFLKEQFSTWKDYRLKPSHVVKNTHIVKMKPVTKLTEDAFEILHYLLKHHNQHTPLNCVHTLLNLWIHNLSSQTEAGKTLSFKIPSPIKKPLGYALKHPEKLFSENS